MDKSEQYIKQCDCPEIQDDKKQSGLVHGDYFYSPTYREWDIVYDKNKCYKFAIINDTIWLPTQSQLQEMVDRLDLYALTICFVHGSPSMVVNKYDSSEAQESKRLYQLYRDSMEQLWLAFVMKEKFNKVWSNDKWEAPI